MKNNKKNILICIILVLIFISTAIVAFFGIKNYQDKKEQEYIQSYIGIINNNYIDFQKEDDENEKFNMLKLQIEEFENYKQFTEIHDSIIDEYQSKINSMKNFFISNYDNEINKNLIENLDNSKDKELIKNNKNNFEKLLEAIKNQKDIVLTEEEFKNYENKINDLINLYNSRLEEIEELEEKEKQEQEKAKQQAAQNNKVSNSNKNNSNSSNNKSSNSHLYSIWWENENGRFEGYTDGFGNIYDKNGNDVTW